MKKLFILFFALSLMLCCNSCTVATYATTQDDVYVEAVDDIVQSNVDINLVIRLGRPYYYNGSILYYLYEGLYYYPYYYDNYWYMRVYRRPFIHTNYHPYFRPHRYDYRFRSDYVRPRGWYQYRPSSRGYTRPGNRPYGRPNIGGGQNRPANPRAGGSRPGTPGSRPSIQRPGQTRSIGGGQQNRSINRPISRGSMRGGRGGR